MAERLSEHFLHIPLQTLDDALFQAGDIALGNAQGIRHLFLCLLLIAGKAKAHADDAFIPGGQMGYGLLDEGMLHVVLDLPEDNIALGSKNIG